MTTLARTAARLPGAIGLPAPSALTAGSCLAAGGLGFAVATGLTMPALALLFVGVGLIVGLRNWRLSVLLLVAYIPVSGLVWIATYPDTGPAALAKDFLFVLPAYAGFFGSYIARGRRILFDGPPLVPLGMFALLVLAQTLNPSVPSLLVGLVGVKVWLLYIPLLFLGYHLIRKRTDLDLLLTIICVGAVIPAVIGIVEAVLLYSGNASTVYSWYGDAGFEATHGFVALEVAGDASVRRVPSTFSSVAQYYLFMSCVVVLSYAWWQMARPGSRARLIRSALWPLFLLAVMTSGSRGALLFLPLLVIGMLLIEGRLGPRLIGALGAIGAGLLVMTVLVGTGVGGFASHLREITAQEWEPVVVNGFREGIEHGFAGLGTGYDTNAARYVTAAGEQRFEEVGGYWQEGWWFKAAIELGLVGLLLLLVVFASLIGRGLQLLRRLRDPGLRAFAAAVIALTIWVAIYNVKGSFLDFDPVNVYFWLLIGILFKLPSLQTGASGRRYAPRRQWAPPRRTSNSGAATTRPSQPATPL